MFDFLTNLCRKPWFVLKTGDFYFYKKYYKNIFWSLNNKLGYRMRNEISKNTAPLSRPNLYPKLRIPLWQHRLFLNFPRFLSQISVVTRDEVGAYKPYLWEQSVFIKGPMFREWLLTKVNVFTNRATRKEK